MAMNNYFDFAENDFQYFLHSYKSGFVANAMAADAQEICEKYINNGVPVLIWASINMKPTFINLSNSWIVENTGERYFWKSNEHCLVLVGYDDENYYFNDPLV